MAGNLKKFVNPRFIKTIDLDYMRRLLARHEDQYTGFSLDVFDQDEAETREAIADLLAGSEAKYPEGLRSDLHRIAELGNAKGLDIIQAQADRQGINLFPDAKTCDDGAPDKKHDPKHLALRVFLEHPDLFDVAADYLAMMTADRLSEFAGRKRGVPVDLTAGKLEAFRLRVAELFKESFLGDFCRIGDYVDGDETNFVISHGTLVSTMPIVEGQQEKVISLRGVSQAVLRYSENTGILRLARIKAGHQKDIAEAFADTVLNEPGMFASDDAQELYSLEVVEKTGASFAMDHQYDPAIEKVLIIEAAADLMVPGKDGYPKVARTLRSRDLTGKALAHFRETPVGFGGSWVLGDHATIPPERGIFLPVTRRMHPEVCRFISDQVYEGRLESHPDTSRQSVTGTSFPDSGAFWVPVFHEGNAQTAPEEVEAIGAAITDLLRGNWTDKDGTTRPIHAGDIIVVAPYNAQVNALAEALPDGIRVGTVDKFQGQEAPICLVSMTASSTEETARGMEFLFSLNRINVAVSRAKGLALVFGAPRLREAKCNTVEQMKLVNTLCALETTAPVIVGANT